jgi:NAD(P)-dependent dehydrogenase (short-subunit alcohol dehydrogenase family)
MNLQNTSAIVCGGASGLGAAAVRCLTAAGVRCSIIDLDVQRGKALAAELGEGTQFHRADITDPDAMAGVVNVAREFPLRILVNTAFIAGGQRIVNRAGEPHDLALFRRLIEVNLVGAFNCMCLAAAAISKAPPLADGERGVVINTASIAAFDGQAGGCAYAAAKAAVAGMTLPAARDLRRQGIRVVTIAPGTFLTPPVAALTDAIREELTQVVLAPGRLGHPEEFGRFVVHACENSYMNGSTFRLDAGARLR